MCQQHNLLVEPCITTANNAPCTLPGVLAALVRDEVDSFTALRPHQVMFWHMFCVQLGALALYKAGIAEIPQNEVRWCELLRGLTPDYPNDEPWSLIVGNWSKPAFLQPPVPEGFELKSEMATPDALDLLITSRNHDLKRAIARQGVMEDWLFALVTLQTGEGYNGTGNYGIARMNGGSSSRPMQCLAPLCSDVAKDMSIRAGLWFQRDVKVMLRARSSGMVESNLCFDETNGKTLLWIDAWPNDSQFQLHDLDPWFIEVCRRVRLKLNCGTIAAVGGNSKHTRINAKAQNGAIGDPWAPVHKTDNKSLTLGTDGDFGYKKTVELLLSGDWKKPLLGNFNEELDKGTLAVVLSAMSRGNSKTEGLKVRIIPLDGEVSRVLGPSQEKIHQLARTQSDEISWFEKALRDALVLAAAQGEQNRINRDLYAYAYKPVKSLDRYADEIFFEHLWARFEAQQSGKDALIREETAFAKKLWKRTQFIFESALPTMPCSSLFRPRAEVRARRALKSKELRCNFPVVLNPSVSNKRAIANAG